MKSVMFSGSYVLTVPATCKTNSVLHAGLCSVHPACFRDRTTARYIAHGGKPLLQSLQEGHTKTCS